MKNNFDIDAYLRQAEAEFSGFDGDDSSFSSNDRLDLSMEGDSNFNSNEKLDLSFNAAPMFNAIQHAPLKQPTPYTVSVTNSTAGTLTCTLFGMNQYLLSPNFNNPVGLTITPTVTTVTYLQLLQQSASQPFETSVLRVQTTNSTQLTTILTITSSDANGQSCTIPLITQNYFRADQFQSGILDVPFSVRIDGNTNLQFPVLGNVTVIFTFFPKNKANSSRWLNGDHSLQTYANPNIGIVGRPVYVAAPPAAARGMIAGR